MDLRGKNVAITGASSGIGLALLKQLLAEGCRVAACARHIETIDIKSENLFLKACDVSRKEEIDSFFDFSLEKLGSIDIFIANAGFAYYERLEQPDWEHISSIVNTNYISGVYSAEKMKALKGNSPYSFVITASAMGLLSLPGYALYCGTKAAVRGFADAYRHEIGKGQHFQVVYPIATKTKFFQRAGNGTPVPWPTQEAEAVAKRVISGIRRGKNHIFPSKMFRITCMVDRVLPFVLKIYVKIHDRNFRKWLDGKEKD